MVVKYKIIRLHSTACFQVSQQTGLFKPQFIEQTQESQPVICVLSCLHNIPRCYLLHCQGTVVWITSYSLEPCLTPIKITQCSDNFNKLQLVTIMSECRKIPFCPVSLPLLASTTHTEGSRHQQRALLFHLYSGLDGHFMDTISLLASGFSLLTPFPASDNSPGRNVLQRLHPLSKGLEAVNFYMFSELKTSGTQWSS